MKKNFVIVLVILTLASLTSCKNGWDKKETKDIKVEKTKSGQIVTTKTGLQYKTIKTGSSNKMPQKNNTVKVHYTGWLEAKGKPEGKGEKFDSSKDRGQPFKFVLGAGRVIKGWDEGVATMTLGETRRLIIPYDLAYGKRGIPGAIPPEATLIFDVELLEIQQ